jgi:carboxyl-terminal processing protease
MILRFNRSPSLHRAAGVLMLAMLLSPCSYAAEKAMAEKQARPHSKTIELLSLFANVFDKVRRSYVTEVTDKEIVEAAINGMLTSLDPHSTYLNEKEAEELNAQNKGEFAGLGIELTMENGLVKVISPVDGSPAADAGIQAGDYIFSVDEEPIFGMTLSEAADKIRGKPGTKVQLTILRDGQPEPLIFNLTRALLKERTARSKLFDDVGYIRLRSFTANTTKSLESEFAKLKKEAKAPLKGLVLDLRNNPGGLLNQAVSVADAFLESGEIVSTRGREPEDNSRLLAQKGDITKGMPIVVLINNGSASASEIVAGALQDHKRGIVLGTKSFGKGSVQTIIPIAGHGAIKLTTARYYTPSGHSIQAEGIKPDIVVEMAKIEYPDSKDSRRISINEASLHKHLVKEKGATSKPFKAPSGAAAEENGNVPASAIDKMGLDKINMTEQAIYASDFQLARALDLLRGLAFVNSEKVLQP